jgi:hypothetical protein
LTLEVPAILSAAADPGPADELHALRTLLDQQPDGGAALLHVLQPSADPRELRAAIDATLSNQLTRAPWPLEDLFPPQVDDAALAAFCAAYRLPRISRTDAASQKFQTKEDWEAYARAPGAIAFTLGDDVLPPLWRSLANPAEAMTHDVRPGEFDGSIEVALFADNGNGLHASLAIDEQVVESRLPYAFHLGDVYYGGGQHEFQRFFERPLEGMFDRTELFMLTGNHEMFARGKWFQELITRKKRDHATRQRQQGEMFRLRGPGFQILGVDTMFVGWDSGRLRSHDHADQAVLDVVKAWLDDRPDDLTILMTTNQPWNRGSKKLSPLYDSLRETIAGRVDLWFWGNVHYAALFEPWSFGSQDASSRRVVGSCIGHGGYPFYTQKGVGDLPAGVRCRWLEKKSRFWPDQRVRPDVAANGWCRLKLTRAGGRWDVLLTFVDWVGRERLRARLSRRDASTIQFDDVQESKAAGVGSPLEWEEVGPV